MMAVSHAVGAGQEQIRRSNIMIACPIIPAALQT
jgi:hypothetical protein